MEYKVILIQGAMNIEIEYLINQLKEKEKIAIAEYEFYKGTISNKTIIISPTKNKIKSVAEALLILFIVLLFFNIVIIMSCFL